jgi:hypothetical protein
MRRRHSRIAAIVLAAAAGGLAAFALKPAAGTSTATLAARNPAVEVRTQVIRRTVHVIRHEPGAALRGSRGPSAVVVAGARPGHARTAASGAHRATAGTGVAAVATRASGGHRTSTGQPTGSSVPVTTHSSGSHGGSAPTPATHPVTTRSSGSHGGSSGPSSSRPVTRSSGGGKHGGDGGDGNGGGDD